MKSLFRFQPMTIFIGLALVAASCSPTGRWENPNLPEERWSGDRAACRNYADDKIEREYAIDQTFSRGGSYGATRTLESMMVRHDALKRRDKLYADCLRSRGYRKAKSK